MQVKQIVLLCVGGVCLVLGAAGVVLPVLPTTPFLLAAAGCFGASRPGLARRLAQSRYFGPYIRSRKNGERIDRKTLVISLIWLWGALALSALLTRSLPVALLLLAVGLGVTVHLLALRRGRR